MQSTFDELYARSQAGEIFENLMDGTPVSYTHLDGDKRQGGYEKAVRRV